MLSLNLATLAGGSNYVTGTALATTGGSGSASLVVNITASAGAITNVTINDGGTGYTSKPEITIVGGGGAGAVAEASVRGPIKNVNITNAGTDYTSEPTVSLSSGLPPREGKPRVLHAAHSRFPPTLFP